MMASKPDESHQSLHEAQRRASMKQQLVRHSAPKSLLLQAPNNIVFELFDTVLKVIQPQTFVEYISDNLFTYLAQNWSTKMTQRIVKRMRRDLALDRRAGLTSAPLIEAASNVDKQLILVNPAKNNKDGQKSGKLNRLTTKIVGRTHYQDGR